MINEQDYTKTEKDGVITFTPKTKEVTGERRRLDKNKQYHTIGFDGLVKWNHEMYYWVDTDIFDYWNYYPTEEQAQAVADLRRHVYKFPAIGGKHLSLVRYWWYISDWSVKRPAYYFNWLPLNTSIEDQEERTRLIQRCYELNGYVTI